MCQKVSMKINNVFHFMNNFSSIIQQGTDRQMDRHMNGRTFVSQFSQCLRALAMLMRYCYMSQCEYGWWTTIMECHQCHHHHHRLMSLSCSSMVSSFAARWQPCYTVQLQLMTTGTHTNTAKLSTRVNETTYTSLHHMQSNFLLVN